MISFRIDRFVLLAVQGILKSLLQHHNSKASILRRSAFFVVQLSLPYIILSHYIFKQGNADDMQKSTAVSLVLMPHLPESASEEEEDPLQLAGEGWCEKRVLCRSRSRSF